MYELWRKLFGHLKVFKKMLLIAVVTFISMLILSITFLVRQEKVMMNEKRVKLQNIVELSYSIVKASYDDFKSGKLSEEDAKNNATNEIRNLRYDVDNYVWINDNQAPYPLMIMHPISESLNGKTMDSSNFNRAIALEFGKNKDEVKPVDNMNIFQAFVEVTNKSNEGYIDYLWTKPTEDGGQTKQMYEKLSYVKEFTPWGWVIGTGIYVDDIKEEFFNSAIKAAIIILCILAVLFFIFYMMTKEIVLKVEFINDGLESFFAYLNRESDDVEIKKIVCTDEFGHMSRLINRNIEKTKAGIQEDRALIDETVNVLSEFEQGDLCQRLHLDVSNPAMMQLKNVLNKMADNLEHNIDGILDVLEKYSNFNYMDKVNTSGIKKDLLKLANGVNSLGESITSMLVENKSNGLTLDDSSEILLSNVKVMNESAAEAASSLEETAAALEEITGNIRSNTQNIAKMASLSHNVTKSANHGEELATSTVSAMEDIDSKVNSINEAISVIDQIAFQTNILSLNAAVEAATAGEAGKGFAVVAQEVRNLASRSAEAAKEIKELVENATTKANEGKNIATDMINGYKTLSSDISQTIDLISDVEMSSKEQLMGIEQINDAVSLLDQQTQQNADVAAHTHDVAVTTDSLAKLIVDNANTKEFNGKDSVKKKDITSTESRDKRDEKKSVPKKPNINKVAQAKKVISESSSDDEWESF